MLKWGKTHSKRATVCLGGVPKREKKNNGRGKLAKAGTDTKKPGGRKYWGVPSRLGGVHANTREA